MGKLVRFKPRRRRSRKWTRSSDYGVSSRAPRRARKQSAGTWRQAFYETRPYLLAIALVTLFVIMGDARNFDAPDFLQGEPEEVSGQFTRCGPGRGTFCVIDGDTFKLGERTVRVVGIDTAEREARCNAEAAQAELSTQALQRWLNRGAFVMTARLDNPSDRYGRDLRTVKRIGPDGTETHLSDFMREEGGARGYWGGWRGGWC